MNKKESVKQKVDKAKEKEKLKKEINKIKDKSIEPKKEKLSATAISEFVDIIKDDDAINEQDLLLLKIKEKEDSFLLDYFNDIVKPTKVYIYDYDKSFVEYHVDDVIIFSKEKPIIRNNITPAQNIKLKNYLDYCVLSVENIYVTIIYNKNITVKYSIQEVKNNKFMFFEKQKLGAFKS